MQKISQAEIHQLEKYFRQKFGTDHITITPGPHDGDSVEVSLGGEFLGTISKDVDEGEISYDFHMAILDIDLETA